MRRLYLQHNVVQILFPVLIYARRSFVTEYQNKNTRTDLLLPEEVSDNIIVIIISLVLRHNVLLLF